MDNQHVLSYKFAVETLRHVLQNVLQPKGYDGTCKLMNECISCLEYIIKDIERDLINEDARIYKPRK